MKLNMVHRIPLKTMPGLLGMCLLGMASQVVGGIIPTPSALYHFDGNAKNAITSSNSATLGNGAVVASTNVRVGSGSLNASVNPDSYATLPEGAGIAGSNHWTLTLWLDPEETAQWGDVINWGTNGLRLANYDGGGTWYLQDTGYNAAWNSYTISTGAEWQFLALTADGTDFKIYTGTKSGETWTLSTAYTHTIVAGESLKAGDTMGLSTNAAMLGAGGNGSFFDEIAIWNSGLAATEIQSVFDAGVNGLPIPEPAAAGMLALGALMMLWRR